jgi:hypothetical protein
MPSDTDKIDVDELEGLVNRNREGGCSHVSLFLPEVESLLRELRALRASEKAWVAVVNELAADLRIDDDTVLNLINRHAELLASAAERSGT